MLVRNLRDGPKWIPGIVIEQTGPVSYKVQVNDQIWCRHTDQLLDHNFVVEPRPEDAKERDIPEIRIPPPVALPESMVVTKTELSIPETEHGSSEPEKQDSNVPTEKSVLRHYLRREHKPPDRLSHKL